MRCIDVSGRVGVGVERRGYVSCIQLGEVAVKKEKVLHSELVL